MDSLTLLMKRPSTWQDCVSIARIKFEKYFKHMALALLSAFPLDTVVSNGSKYLFEKRFLTNSLNHLFYGLLC